MKNVELDENERSMFNKSHQGNANVISESGMYFVLANHKQKLFVNG
jgi:hypothetical protein